MASTYLSRTPSSAGNRKTWTWSGWVKRGNLGTTTGDQSIFDARESGNGNPSFGMQFDGNAGGGASNDAIDILMFTSSIDYRLITTQVFRDVSAWYHIVFAVDTTQATASDRLKLYVNGSQITAFDTETYPSLNFEGAVNNNKRHAMGSIAYGGDYFDGYMAEVHFIDGTAYTPTTFGETNTDGIWVPKIGPSVTYGTNGFYLKFENSGAMGTDSSGNSNTFSVGGGTVRQVPDSPTNVFPTLNPLVSVSPSPTLSEGNLRSTPSGNGNHTTGATMFIPENSGKWYAETVLTYVNNQSGAFAIQDANNIQASIATYSGQYSVLWQASGTDYYATHDGSSATNSTNATISVGDIFQIAYDSTNGKVWFGRNNTWITGNPSTDTSPTYSSITGDKVFTTTGYRVTSGSSYTAQQVNFGQDSSFSGSKTAQNNADANGEGDFYYAPPTGFLALCTDNLSSALTIPINKGADNFNTVLYTGNSSNGHGITGVGFQPDFTWIKARTDIRTHSLLDINRGAGKILSSNNTNAEYTDTTAFASFDSDGFTVGTTENYINNSSHNYVGWNWRGSNTTASNTDGSITSTVSANQTSGFSIVTYTGNATNNATVGHGLGKTPKIYIVKKRDASAGWVFFTTAIDGTLDYLFLNDTFAPAGNLTQNLPTSSVFSLTAASDNNASGGTFVSYVFAEIEGYSKIGSYTGNGSTNGAFVYTGFRPSFILMKSSTSAENWLIYDSKRDPYNVTDEALLPNSSSASGGSANAMDLLSNGFKFRSSAGSLNGSGQTYIYMAFAENPLVSSTGTPVTAR
jgi:hypothetical protein